MHTHTHTQKMFTDAPVFLLLFDVYTSHNVYRGQKYILNCELVVFGYVYVTKLMFQCCCCFFFKCSFTECL